MGMTLRGSHKGKCDGGGREEEEEERRRRRRRSGFGFGF
jgi:hypothetical protein